MKVTGKVYSYSRFSVLKQEGGNSTERQRTYAEKWASDHGLKLDAELTMLDRGLSAFHQKHVKSGAFGVFLKAIEADKVPAGSVLIVEDLDRMSRAEPIVAQAQWTQIIMAGITIVTVIDDQVYSREIVKREPMKLVMSMMKMIRANEESETKRDRVSKAIRGACQRWVSGESRKIIRAGNTPAWLEAVDGKWKMVPERLAALQLAIALYRQGKGTPLIAQELNERGMHVSGLPVTSGYLVRVLSQTALYGEKHLEILGEVFELKDYYPPVMSRTEWDELQELISGRSRVHVRGTIPSLLTGTGVTKCGYCGSPMIAQNMESAPKDENGRIRDCNRRLNCVNSKRNACSVAGSCSSVPIERALMDYCSDKMNLQALYGDDRTALQQKNLAAVRAKLATVDKKLERLMDAMLDDDTVVPAAFRKRAHDLEVEQAALQAEVNKAAADLKAVQRANIADADTLWRDLVDGVNALDYDARMQARQMVSDTFETIMVYHHGARPGKDPKGLIDLELLAKGGEALRLRVDAKTGVWFTADGKRSAIRETKSTKPAAKKTAKRVREFA